MNLPKTVVDKPIVFICGHRKSGTTMFHNLFDGHPELCVYPMDINLLYGYFPNFNSVSTSTEELEARVDRVVFDDLVKTAALGNVIDVKKLKEFFKKNMKGQSYSDVNEVIGALLKAYSELESKEKKYYVVKETGIEMYAKEIKKWFPNCKFIHLIRDPRDNFAAIKSGLKKKYESYGDSDISLLFSVIFRNLWGFKMAHINQRLLGESSYKLVKFEDIVAQPELMMRDISQWLGIDFDISSLTPTVCGHNTSGNNFSGKNFSTVSSEHVSKWTDRITDEEVAMLEFAFGSEMSLFGYEASSSDASKAESVSDFYKHMNYKYFYFDRFSE
jgi:protein-tyrosine sulfotransferase